MNKVFLIGRLTKDIELKLTNTGVEVTTFTLAVQFDKDQQAYFINCVAWKQSAKFLSQYTRKGSLISVEGRLQVRDYEGKNGKVYVTEVVAERVENLTPRDKSEKIEQSNNDDEQLDVDTDDLPF